MLFPDTSSSRKQARTAMILPVALLAFLLVSSCSCMLSPARTFRKAAQNRITLISWNVETFFDAETDGTEYEDFTGIKSKWTTDKYKERLKRLAGYMMEKDADIYCFMEVENAAVVLDLSNQLQASDAYGSKWQYTAFGKEDGSAIGCAVFSKFPITSLTMHQLDFRAALPGSQFTGYQPGDVLTTPVLRPLLEVRMPLPDQLKADDGGGSPETLALFVCHWKSKSGDEAGTAVWRSAQEAVLAGRMSRALAEGCAVAACGDLNRDLAEFTWSRQKNCVELKGFSEKVTAYSPWFEASEKGSYVYQDEWNRIDHLFVAGGMRIEGFSADTEGSHVTAAGKPWEYNVWTGEGWSDHLPLKASLTMSAQQVQH